MNAVTYGRLQRCYTRIDQALAKYNSLSDAKVIRFFHIMLEYVLDEWSRIGVAGYEIQHMSPQLEQTAKIGFISIAGNFVRIESPMLDWIEANPWEELFNVAALRPRIGSGTGSGSV